MHSATKALALIAFSLSCTGCLMTNVEKDVSREVIRDGDTQHIVETVKTENSLLLFLIPLYLGVNTEQTVVPGSTKPVRQKLSLSKRQKKAVKQDGMKKATGTDAKAASASEKKAEKEMKP